MSFFQSIVMPTDSGHIRPAHPAEAPQLSDIAKRAKAHWGYSQELLDLWSEDLTILPDSCDGESLWAFELNGTVIGFGEILPEGDTFLLDDLWIDPVHIGRGFGKQLFNFLRDLSASRGAKALRIESDPYATGFYERMGARIVGEVHSESVPDRVLPVLQLDLTPPENTTIYPE